MPGTEEKNKPKWLAWIANFWYHHKYPFLLGLLAVVTVTVALLSGGRTDKNDAFLTYAGPYVLSDREKKQAASDCAALLADGGEEKEVSFSAIYYMTAEQIRARLEEDPAFTVFDRLLAENLDRFDREFEAGDTVIWLVDPGLYDRRAVKGEWISLLEVLPKMPEQGIYDQFAVRFLETDFGKTYFSYLPEDTLLCMRRNNKYASMGGQGAASEEAFERSCALFKKILSYRAG